VRHRDLILDRLIVALAKNGGAMWCKDLVSAFEDLEDHQVRDSARAASRQRHAKIRRVRDGLYALAQPGIVRAEEMGIRLTVGKANAKARRLIGYLKIQAKRDALRERRRLKKERARRARMARIRRIADMGPRRLVEVELPEWMIRELDDELAARGLTRGRRRLVRMAWQLAKEQIQSWPTLSVPDRDTPPEDEFVPPPIDPPRATAPKPPVFRELILERRNSIREAARKAEDQRRLIERCGLVLSLAENGPISIEDAADALGVRYDMATVWLRRLVEAGFMRRLQRGSYALAHADEHGHVKTLRERIKAALWFEAKSISELAVDLGESRSRVASAVKQMRIERKIYSQKWGVYALRRGQGRGPVGELLVSTADPAVSVRRGRAGEVAEDG